MTKRGFLYLKNTLILSVLLFLFISIPPVFASQINQTLTYDGNGNLITGDGKYREYNEFNQLLRVYDVSYPNGTILESYLYHPTEDRILIKYGDYASSTPGNAVVYVNENLEKSYDNLGGTPRTNYTYYTFDENGLVGQITKNSTNATLRTLYYHNDYSGSVSLITNSSGNILEQTFYDPFGVILAGGDASRYSYEGKEFSSVTEDFDFHFRKYDPSLMIFTQPDSVVANIYDPQTLNRYAFERNNPYKYIDKDGKVPMQSILNKQNIWRQNQLREVSIFREDLREAWNSDDSSPYRFFWSITLKPFYHFTKSSVGLLTLAITGKNNPFASQDPWQSTEDLIFSAGEIGLTFMGLEGVGGKAVTYLSGADTVYSAYQTGFLSYIYNHVNDVTCSIQYDISKSSTSKLSKSSSSTTNSNSQSSLNNDISIIDTVKDTIKSIITSVIKEIGGLFKRND